jgi:NitT/TauT family transport system substrate-binding protein
MPRVQSIVVALGVALFVVAGAAAQGGPKVSIVETWPISSESMGDPVGIDKGFFGNLQVQVVNSPGQSPIDRVLALARAGEIVFGIDYPYNVLEARETQKLPLVVVAHDFQKSALYLLSWVPLNSPKDVKGTVGTWSGYDKQIKAMIGPGWEQRIKIVTQQGDPATIGAWMNRQYDFAHAMGYNEVLVARRVVKEKYFVYSYADDFGMQWPENVLFTTEKIVRDYPQVVQGMDFLASVIQTPAARQYGLGYVDPTAWNRLTRDLVGARIFLSVSNVAAAYTTKFPSGVKPSP